MSIDPHEALGAKRDAETRGDKQARPQASRAVSVLMAGIGGYGRHYLAALLADHVPQGRARLAGVVDPEASRSPLWPVVDEMGVPVCRTVDEFYEHGHAADLAVIVSPIHWHVPQSLVALAHGSHVLSEKPLGATVQDAEALVVARDRSGCFVEIGYQWSFSAAIRTLKADILAGLFGRPRRLATLCCWPRDFAYYERNTWAGRLRDPATGWWVLDGPANNAMAHFLHNLLFLAGPAPHLSATPSTVQAELYRANDIESCDTAALRVFTTEGVEIGFWASHATGRAIDPRFRLEFEEATVWFGHGDGGIVARSRAGNEKHYGVPDDTRQFRKLAVAIERAARTNLFDAARASGGRAAQRAPAAADRDPIHARRSDDWCGVEAAMMQTRCVNGAHDSAAAIQPLPEALIHRDGLRRRVIVEGLDDLLERCYERRTLPGEEGVPWAVAGRTVDLTNYRWFPSGGAAGLPPAGLSGEYR